MKYVLLLALCVSALAAGERKSGYFRGKAVSYEVIDGYAVTEGDIVLGTAEELAASKPGAAELSSKSGSHDAIGIPFTTRRWPDGVIPYVIDSDIPNQKRVTDGIQHWNDNTGLDLIPRTSESNYVRFSRIPGGGGLCGNSNIGMVGGAQRINLADDCDAATTIHEIGHAVGLFHEQSRQDRDFYMRVLYQNMDKRDFSQYNQHIADGGDLGDYDFGSIMQYSNFADSRSGDATVQSIPAGIPFRADSVLSAAEIDAVNRMYNLPVDGTIVSSYPAGLLIVVDGETFRSPKRFNWTAGSRHTLATVSPQLAGDGVYRYSFARWSDDGSAEHAVTVSPGRTVYTAAFSREFKLPLTVSPAGSGTLAVNPPSQDGYFPDGSSIEVTPVPNPGFSFLSWSGFGSFSAHGVSPNPLRVNVRGPDTRYNAQFTAAANVTRVTSDPPGRTVSIDGLSTVLPRNFTWAAGTNHTINVQDKSQQNFSGTSQFLFRDWSDQGAASHMVTATDKPQTFTANFTTQYLLTASNPNGTGGTVIVNPSSPDNFYDAGSTVTLSPTASGQYKFANWGGDLSGNSFPGSVVMDEQKSITANFLVPKSVSTRALVNAANYVFVNGVAPGEIVTIFGLDFGPEALTTLQIDPLTRRAATVLADTRVLFDGVAAPLIYVSPNQISAVAPYGLAGKSSTVLRVEYKGQASNGIIWPVTSAEPALFTFDASGKGPGALLNENGSVNTAENPAAKGSVVVLYGTGEGAVDQANLDGKPSAAPLAKPRLPVRVRIAGRDAEVLYAGPAPGLIAGVLQINVKIPADSPSGAVPVQLLVGDYASPRDVSIAVQ